LTGLIVTDKGLGSPRNATRRGYQTSRSLASKVSNLGAQGPGVTTEQLMQELRASCAAADVSAESCEDALLLVLTPESYSSNNTADTPGGNAFISPAQVGAEHAHGMCLASDGCNSRSGSMR
jgi:hypothetical protein